ncbi:hypothetical protein IEQ34_011882 [Dendrobium chrysotoxum]|uniref:Protein COFACTOR ASSEMBLY OF COMPLEX C SUBUNIT B CCB3, chloroplastic n=1 Tax=Dendrobium chrysotoxum TaxID=161865 RepID=A0AAV7GTK5_DENCH|nr:hypothetical protein IEQ34_011882 [Dendrobium chrysotoxum]
MKKLQTNGSHPTHHIPPLTKIKTKETNSARSIFIIPADLYDSTKMLEGVKSFSTGLHLFILLISTNKKCRKDVRKILLPNPSRRLKHTACCLDPVQITPASHSVVANLKAIKILSESMQRVVSSHKQSLIMADLDPHTAKLLIAITGPFLSTFALLFILRIVMSWYPKLPVGKLPYVIAYAPTEPFLVITRKVIPPLGGVDVTPVVWFGLVSFLNEILVGPQGLLVLLSRQV